ncbi:MAG: peptidase domain-containing ABC transporter [Bacteroidales bacterium]|nr:peptidase domain-containing ABC transporter [Bacteroidales bacterium]MDD3272597.1 peptidase domain-containing ABC transporter [Bacteroidales bacterium]MDD4057418.1 peptidase domain-containing ABC transporter [Bacteroidales bacterium]
MQCREADEELEFLSGPGEVREKIPPSVFQKRFSTKFRRRREMGYSIKIRQHDISDCGAACLASVSAYWGLKLPIARIRLFSNTDSRGTTIKGLIDAARTFGFNAEGYKGQKNSLYKIQKPVILHLQKRGGLLHFVVLYGIRNQKLRIMDPLDGEIHNVEFEELLSEWSGKLVTISPAERFNKGEEGVSISSRLFGLLISNRRSLGKAMVAAILFTVASFAISLFIKIILDKIIPSGEMINLTIASLLAALVFILSLILSWVRSTILVKVGISMDMELMGKYIRHLVKLPGIFYDARETGEITSRISDAAKIRSYLTSTLSGLGISAIMLIFATGAMFALSPRMAIPALSAIPVYFGLFRLADIFNKREQRTIMERGAKFENGIIETVKSHLAIKYSSSENYFAGRCTSALSSLLESVEKSARVAILTGSAADFASRLLILLVLWLGGIEMMNGNITPGELVAFFTIVSLFTSPLAELVSSSPEIREGTVAASRLFEILDLETEQLDGGIVHNTAAPVSVKISNVSFSYPGRVTLFKDINMEFRCGEITAVTGESGCGKSTLISLLTRLRRPSLGVIYADNLNIDHINLRCWRDMVAVVPQNPGLFAGTILENIAPGEEEPDTSRVIEICEQLGMTGFIASFPLGFEAPVGEGGSLLSGGQQQKVALARALYKDSHILIIDEGTSSMDGDSEFLAERALKMEREKGRIVIIISHKERSKVISDRIYNM